MRKKIQSDAENEAIANTKKNRASEMRKKIQSDAENEEIAFDQSKSKRNQYQIIIQI